MPSNSVDYRLLSSSVRGISQARILEWVAISSSRGSSRPRDWTWVSCGSCTGGWVLYHQATWEVSCFGFPGSHQRWACIPCTEGGVLTTGLLGKSSVLIFFSHLWSHASACSSVHFLPRCLFFSIKMLLPWDQGPGRAVRITTSRVSGSALVVCAGRWAGCLHRKRKVRSFPSTPFICSPLHDIVC